MDRPGVRQVPEGSGEQGKMEKTGCKIIFGAPMTLAVKGLMMMMMMMMQHCTLCCAALYSSTALYSVLCCGSALYIVLCFLVLYCIVPQLCIVYLALM